MIFAYTPVKDSAVYPTTWSDFLTQMEKETGKKVQFFPVCNNAAQITAMRAGRLHVAGLNTGSNPLAVACAGFRSFTIMAAKAVLCAGTDDPFVGQAEYGNTWHDAGRHSGRACGIYGGPKHHALGSISAPFRIVYYCRIAVYKLVHLVDVGLKRQASLNLLSWPQVTMILITVVISEWVSGRVRTALI